MQTVRRMLVALLFIGLALGMAPAAVRGGQDQMPRSVDPHLWRLVREQPGAKIPVIIQLRGPVADPALLVAKFGGRLNGKLRLVNGLRAELPVAMVAALGKSALVQYISVDTPLKLTAIDSGGLQTTYNQTVGAPPVWNTAGLTGSGVGVAVLDTGFEPHDDLKDHLTVINTNPKALTGSDGNGHGTHVAGIIAGRAPSGRYYGVAPDAQVIGVKVADDQGSTTEGDLIQGMQWVYDNRVKYNIRVVNISLTGTAEMSYLTSPLDAAVERLWRAGIFVVVAAGNRGDAANAVRFPPGNDGFALTVGALDDSGTADTSDDVLAFFSSRGTTQDSLLKPEVVAPGRRIISTL
ncbi:MAG: peptidase and in kexin sedolisin, partial [Firmicutes bacterium]|nr:peptidase and in kexin sedolisin [Bacillota bacterium]